MQIGGKRTNNVKMKGLDDTQPLFCLFFLFYFLTKDNCEVWHGPRLLSLKLNKSRGFFE